MVGFRLYIDCLNGKSWFFPGPMETRSPGFRNVLSIFLLLGCFVSCNKTAFNPESFQRKVIALHKILDYIRDRPEQMNTDVIFGITLTEANLAATLLHKNARYLENRFFNCLKEIILLCDTIRKDLLNIVAPRNENDFLLQLTLNDPSLWIKPISWRLTFTEKSKFNSRLNYREVINLIWRGTPNETESDRCLSAIVRSSLNLVGCQIPKTCAEILIRNDGTAGYPLTHRLLMVQIAKAFNCREIKSMPFSDLISVYCARILQDLLNLEAWSFPSVAPDLMNEQVVLCGMEGFYEFVDKRYEDLILEWSHKTHGCFSAFGFHKKKEITRRSSSATDFQCDNHSTGLAAASLSLFIRKDVQDL